MYIYSAGDIILPTTYVQLQLDYKSKLIINVNKTNFNLLSKLIFSVIFLVLTRSSWLATYTEVPLALHPYFDIHLVRSESKIKCYNH